LKSIKDQIKEKSLKGAYLLYGEEDFLKDYYTNSISDLCTCDGPVEFNLLKINNEKIDNDKVAEFMLSFPFMAEKKVLIIKNSGLFSKASESDKKFWTDTLNSMPDYVITVFCEDSVDKRTALFKAISANHTVEEFPLCKEGELINWFARYLGKYGKSMTKEDICYVIENVGRSMYLLKSEADKLIAYSLGKADLISSEAVKKSVCRSLEGKVFELIDNIIGARRQKVMQQIADLKTLKEQPIMVVALIFRQFSILRKIKILQNDFSVAEISQKTKLRDFIVKKHISQLKSFTIDELERGIFLCSKADEEIKGGLCDPWLSVEKLAASLINAEG